MDGFLPFRQVCINAKSADETFGIPKDCTGYPYLTAYLSGTGTVTSGVVTFEEADYDPKQNGSYTGTWAVITTFNATTTPLTDLTVPVQFPIGGYAFVRARISTVIGGGGTVTVVLRGMPGA